MKNRITVFAAALAAAVALALPAAADPTGGPAPAFTLPARGGKDMSLAQYRGQVPRVAGE